MLRPASVVAVVSLVLVGCPKKAPEPVAPPVGWHQLEGWMGECYFPPDFSALPAGDIRRARSEALTAVMEQWAGGHGLGTSFDSGAITSTETVLLGLPEKIDQVAAENLTYCKAAMTGGGTTAWSSWLDSLPRQLMTGECAGSLPGDIYNYLDLGIGWQNPQHVCEGDVIAITASSNDYYQVDDDGPWINADGDPDKAASGENYVCTTEGCLAGQLVLRFRPDEGGESIVPVGTGLEYRAPAHGTIEIMANDLSFYNNRFKVERGVAHHTQITYKLVD